MRTARAAFAAALVVSAAVAWLAAQPEERRLAPAVVIVSPGLSPQAQAPAPPTGTGVILGRVVDAGSGAPIAGAIVSLRSMGAGRAGRAGATGPAAAAGAGGAGGAAGAAGGVGAETPRVALPNLARAGGPGASAPPREITDASGHFVFHDLPAGNTQLTATSLGYVDASYGQGRPGGPARPLSLADGAHQTDVVIRMWRFGVISGTVVDERGEPAVGVAVRVLRRIANGPGGQPRYAAGASTTTDDRGAYRIGKLVPGEFVVSAPQTQVTVPAAVAETFLQSLVSGAPATSGMMLDIMSSGGQALLPNGGGVRVGDFVLQSSGAGRGLPIPPVGGSGEIAVYPAEYYPDAATAAQATPIVLASGEEKSGVDLQLHLVPTARVSGLVTGPAGPIANVAVRLQRAGGDDVQNDATSDVASTITMKDGQFVFLGVPTGQYVARVVKPPRPSLPPELASSPAAQMAFGNNLSAAPTGIAAQLLAGFTPVTVTGSDVADVAITLREGVHASGHVEFDGAAAHPTPTQLQAATIALTPLDGQNIATIQPSRVGADGQFTTGGYPVGRYLVGAVRMPQPWTLESISVGGRPLTEPIDLVDDVSDLVLTYTDKGGQLAGTVRDGASAVPATVLVFSADRREWVQDPLNLRQPRTVQAANTGAYSIASLLPGDYCVVAMPDTDLPEHFETRWLESLAAGAARVTITAGEHKSADLSLVRGR